MRDCDRVIHENVAFFNRSQRERERERERERAGCQFRTLSRYLTRLGTPSISRVELFITHIYLILPSAICDGKFNSGHKKLNYVLLKSICHERIVKSTKLKKNWIIITILSSKLCSHSPTPTIFDRRPTMVFSTAGCNMHFDRGLVTYFRLWAALLLFDRGTYSTFSIVGYTDIFDRRLQSTFSTQGCNEHLSIQGCNVHFRLGAAFANSTVFMSPIIIGWSRSVAI